jgi:DNA-binding transcriptional LysR family regulator
MDRFAAISAFVAVAERKGFAPAARQLGLSGSRVTRLVASLEERLGARLFQRTTRVVRLTDAGARFFERAQRLLADLDEAERMAEGERAAPAGRLVVTAPVMFGRLHVMPLIASYQRRYAGVQVELSLVDRIVNLVEEGIDVAVRIGLLGDSSEVARRVGWVRRVVAAAPAYLAERGAPREPEDLLQHDLVAFTGQTAADRWPFWQDGQSREVTAKPRLIVNDAAAAVWSAANGGGLVMALSYQIAAEVRDGKLRLVLEDWEPPPVPVQLVYPSSRLLSAKVRALVDLAAETCEWSFDRLPGPRTRKRRRTPTE